MFHMADLDLDLVHAIRHLLLHSRLIHPAFQCPKGFRQLLAIGAKLLLESRVILICRPPLSFQLHHSGQQFCLALLHLLPKCENPMLESHQMLSGLSVSTGYSRIVPMVLGGLHKDTGSSWGELP